MAKGFFMSRVEFNWQGDLILENAVKAFQETCVLLGVEFTKAITTPGLFSGFPQDLVDTGRLRSSQQQNVLSDYLVSFEWNTDYAIHLHEGYETRAGKEIQGRPWTKYAIENFAFTKNFALIYRGGL
jgi:hypothetical protein